jgi:hypothetical protein
MDDLGTPVAGLAAVPTDSTAGPGTPAKAPTLDDLEKLYGAAPAGQAPRSQAPSLDDLEKQYAPQGGSGNIDLRDGAPRKNAPSATPQGTDQGAGFVDQVKEFSQNLTTEEGREKIGKAVYHGVVDPLATGATAALGPYFIGRQAIANAAAAGKPKPWWEPNVGTSTGDVAKAAAVIATSVLPVGDLAAAPAKAALEKLAPSAAARVAELLGGEGVASTAARVAAGTAKSAAHGAAIGAASDPDHPLTAAELGAAGGAVLHTAGAVGGEIAGDVAGDVKDKIGGYKLRKADEILNARRTGTNYYPEEDPNRLIPSKSGQAPPPPPPKVQVTPHVTPEAPAGPDFEVEQNSTPPVSPGEAAPKNSEVAPKAPPPENKSGAE